MSNSGEFTKNLVLIVKKLVDFIFYSWNSVIQLISKFAEIRGIFRLETSYTQKIFTTQSFFDEISWNFEETCILPSCLGIPICSQIGKHFIITNFSKTVCKIIYVKAFEFIDHLRCVWQQTSCSQLNITNSDIYF